MVLSINCDLYKNKIIETNLKKKKTFPSVNVIVE